MYDALLNRYRFSCPATDEHAWVPVSAFRSVRRLKGATNPAVFRVAYHCTCGEMHESLISHDTLDWEPLGTETSGIFHNLLTGSRELLAPELGEMAGTMIRQGKWPWTFFCYPESAPRPGFPSSLRMVSPVEHSGPERHGVLFRCFTCERMTINLVSRQHLDVPFYNDPSLHYVDRVVGKDRLTTEEAFRHQLDSGRYRCEWLDEAG